MHVLVFLIFGCGILFVYPSKLLCCANNTHNSILPMLP